MVRSCSSLRSATNVPPRRPTVRVTSPRRASLASAWRSVIRLTPNQAARSCSDGMRSPGASRPAPIASASQSSIWPYTVAPDPRRISGGAGPRIPGATRARRLSGAARAAAVPGAARALRGLDGSGIGQPLTLPWSPSVTSGASSPAGAMMGANSFLRPTAR